MRMNDGVCGVVPGASHGVKSTNRFEGNYGNPRAPR